MNENEKQVTSETPSKLGRDADKQEYGVTYEQCVAYYIVGKLVLDGALDPRNFNFDRMPDGMPFVVNSIAQCINDGLESYGWRDGLFRLIDWGSGKPSEQGGAE